MNMRCLSDMAEIQDLRKIVKQNEEFIKTSEEEFAIIADAAEEIKLFCDDESVIDIVEFIVAVATGDYNCLVDEEVIDVEEKDMDDPWEFRS